MRWQLTLQLAVGLAALFGVGYTTIDHYVEPPTEALLSRMASAEASSAASDAAIEWGRMKSVEQRLVKAAAENPILSTLGSQFPQGEPRQRALKAALEALVSQAGQDGQAVLASVQGAVIASAGELAPQLTKSAAVKDALLGATAVRFEINEGAGRLVAAAPVTTPTGSTVLAVLVLANPVDNQRLNSWTSHLPIGASIVLASGKDIVATTLAGKKAVEFVAPETGVNVVIDGETFTTSSRELVDDAGGVIRAIGVARRDQSALVAIKGRVQFLVMAFGALSILLAVAVMMMSPIRARVEVPAEDEEEGEVERAGTDRPKRNRRHADDEIDTFFDDSMLGDPRQPVNRMPPQPSAQTTTPPFQSARAIPLGPPPPSPIAYSSQAQPPPGSLADRSDTAKLPARKPTSGDHGIEAIPLPSRPIAASVTDPAFDAIAAAAMTSAPPPVQPRMDQQQQQALIDPHTDLPMPIEHLQLPTTRESVQPPYARSRSTAQSASSTSRSWSGNGGGEDPWRNASLGPSQMRQASHQTSDDLPRTRAEAIPSRSQSLSTSGPPMSSSRPYQPSQSASASLNREPVPYDEEHYRVVYNEFVGSKARLGEVVDNITFEGFSSKLRSSEKELIDKHGCKAVRFQVLVKDRQVSLRPQLVR
jgi:hypothetical protein